MNATPRFIPHPPHPPPNKQGIYPALSEATYIIHISDGGPLLKDTLQGEVLEQQLSLPGLAVAGCDYFLEPFRSDQRLVSITLVPDLSCNAVATTIATTTTTATTDQEEQRRLYELEMKDPSYLHYWMDLMSKNMNGRDALVEGVLSSHHHRYHHCRRHHRHHHRHPLEGISEQVYHFEGLKYTLDGLFGAGSGGNSGGSTNSGPTQEGPLAPSNGGMTLQLSLEDMNAGESETVRLLNPDTHRADGIFDSVLWGHWPIPEPYYLEAKTPKLVGLKGGSVCVFIVSLLFVPWSLPMSMRF